LGVAADGEFALAGAAFEQLRALTRSILSGIEGVTVEGLGALVGQHAREGN